MANQDLNEIVNAVGYDYVGIREGRDASDIPATSIIGESGGLLGSYLTKLSSSGNVIIVSDPVAYSNKGVVRVYRWEDAKWVQLGDDIIGAEPNRSSDANSGLCGAISGNGNRIVIGSPWFDTESDKNVGRVRVYDYENNNWVNKFTIQGAAVGDPDLDQERFGSSLDLSDDGSLMVVMSEQQYQTGTHGIGYVIDISSDSAYNIESTLTRITTNAKYGYDVSLAKSTKDKIVVSSTDVSTLSADKRD